LDSQLSFIKKTNTNDYNEIDKIYVPSNSSLVSGTTRENMHWNYWI